METFKIVVRAGNVDFLRIYLEESLSQESWDFPKEFSDQGTRIFKET